MNKTLIILLLIMLLCPNYQAETIGKYLGEEINFEKLKIQNKNIEKKRLKEKFSLYLENRTYDKILEEYNIVITKDDITAESKKMVQKQFNEMSVDDKKVLISEAKDIISAISAVEKGMTHNDAWQKFLKKHEHIMKNSLEWLPKRKKMYQLMAQGKLLEAAIADRSLDQYSVYKVKCDKIMDAIYKTDPQLSKEVDSISQLTDDVMIGISFRGSNLKKSLTKVQAYCDLNNLFEAQKEFYQKFPKLNYHSSTLNKFKLDQLTDTNKTVIMQKLLSIHYRLTEKSLSKMYLELTSELSLKTRSLLASRSAFARSPQYDIILKGKKGDTGLTLKGDEFVYIKDVQKSSQNSTNLKKKRLMRAVDERVKEMISKNLKLEKKYSFLKN